MAGLIRKERSPATLLPSHRARLIRKERSRARAEHSRNNLDFSVKFVSEHLRTLRKQPRAARFRVYSTDDLLCHFLVIARNLPFFEELHAKDSRFLP